MKIVIDPGHGGSDRANRGANGYIEADGVLDIGLRLRQLLQNAGYEVYMTREKDQTVSLADRSAFANNLGADLFISIHTNAAGDVTANGIEVFHSYNGERGEQYQEKARIAAEAIQKKLVEKTGLRNRGVKTRLIDNFNSPYYGQDYYSVIRRTQMPSLIVEAGFHTNLTEESLLLTAQFRQLVAQSIYEAVLGLSPPSQGQIETPGVTLRNISTNIHGMDQVVEGIFWNNRNYVPIRFLEQFGYTVEWDQQTGKVVIKYRI